MSQRLLRAALAVHVTALGLGLGGTGCSQAKRDEVPPDCTLADQFELAPVAGFEAMFWYAVPDRTIQQGVETSATTATPLPTAQESLPCGYSQGIQFKSSGNHDWGSFIGVYHLRDTMNVLLPLDGGDATGFEGLSFWAKSRWDKGLTLALTDTMSDDEAGICEPSSYYVNDAGTIVGSDAGTQVSNPDFNDVNGVPNPNACGNSFDTLLLLSERWAFYTIPFKHFRQTRQDPSLKPNGLDLANIWRLLIRAPRGAMVDASFSNFAWYRTKPAN